MSNSKLVLKLPQGVVWGILALATLSCTQGSRPTPQADSPTAALAARPSVIAANTVLCDLTQQIAGDTVALTCLLDYGQDPHVYRPSPSDRAAIDDADLILYGGYEFEPAVIGLIQATSNSAPKIAVYEEAVPEPIMAQGHSHDHAEAGHAGDEHSEADPDHEHHDHEHTGHEHTGHGSGDTAALTPDPHVWQNAANNAAIVAVLVEHLNTAAPDNAEQYTQRGNDLQAQFTQLDQWIQAQTATVPAANRSLVTTHDAFRYFAQAYGFEVGGVLSGLSTAETPSASTLTGLVRDIKAAEVPAVFSEATTNPKLIETVARDAGVTVADQPLYDAGPGGPGSEAETVQAMLVANTCNIVNALKGTCDVTSAPL
ncbi:MAG: zinc ABC transporter substrate-binding protein [Cyanobacteria bacterium Co-bin13]|nr:zinc ABC transporter substrate-binding protein [Cyanobacteria bacterium Co-bin13]